MVSTNLPVPTRALAVGAHPDDVEFGAGSTLAKWAASGCEVSLVVCTDGSKGTWDRTADLTALVQTRRAEAQAAAERLGATGQVRFLDVVDGELENRRDIRSILARHIRELQPQVLLGHDPWKRYRLHPDHRAAGFLTCDALVAARDPHFFPEHQLTPHRPAALLLFEADEPNHLELVEASHVETKIAALEAHRSQYQSTMFIDGDDAAGGQAAEQRARFHREIWDQVDNGDGWAERFRLMATDR